MEIEVRGHRCIYDLAGDGPCLTLLHSVGLSTRQGWRHQTDFFSRSFRVLSFDFRGLGESGRGTAPLGVDTFAEDLADLLGQLGITQTIVMGVSLGGFVAQALALRRPDLVARLVLVSTAAKIFAGHAGRREARNEQIRRQGMAAAADHQLVSHFPSDFVAAHPAVMAWYKSHYLANDPESYIAIMDDLGRFDSSANLRAIRCPTLIVAGDHDATSVAGRRPLDSAEQLQALIPGAELAVIAGAHHYPQIDHAAAFNERVLGFLTAHGKQPVGWHGARLG